MSDYEISDEVLIKQFQDGDVRSFNHIVLRYKDRLIHFVHGFVHDIDKAEDLVQDTFMKLYTHKDSYREIAKIFYLVIYNCGKFSTYRATKIETP